MTIEEEEKNNNNVGGSGDGNLQCQNHPLNNKNGGICASCLQEKLAKLLLSSSLSIFPSSSSSSSNSSSPFRSANQHSFSTSTNHSHYHNNNRSPIPFIIFTQNQKKKKMKDITTRNLHSSTSDNNSMVFKRSNSVSTVARLTHSRRSFWSFLFSSNPKRIQSSNNSKLEDSNNVEDKTISFNGKVSRSRSLGCGGRSFSGDFFGDCALRRVESQREPKVTPAIYSVGQDRVRCGGLFSGFSITSSSSTYDNVNQGRTYVGTRGEKKLPMSVTTHRRSKSWGWAFVSPIKAFSSKRETVAAGSDKNNQGPNLGAIPSLLVV